MIFIRRSLKRFTSGMESRKRSDTATPTPFVVLGLPKCKTLKPRPMSLDLLPDHLVSHNAQRSILRCSRAVANSLERPVSEWNVFGTGGAISTYTGAPSLGFSRLAEAK
ncbi:unnamed protein product [Nippostrongylus brasiliensis]|uniref:Uncharacterized protein n=1 Tax=Nippostrongylus brasiliensis TaxID=27835 RepID=A0A0N4YIX0_NIPBR|nr:unnamed protein product [Nippostrongylus brasiliensis]